MTEHAGPAPGPTSSAPIVVGVDGGPSSQAALNWAVDHAAASGASVLAVTVCPLQPLPAPPLPVAPARAPADPHADLQHHRDLLRRAVATARRRQGDVEVSEIVETGSAGAILCGRAKDAGARLLVVGSHGRGAVMRALLGSVSSFCIEHAPCPVLVLPARLSANANAGQPVGQGRR